MPMVIAAFHEVVHSLHEFVKKERTGLKLAIFRITLFGDGLVGDDSLDLSGTGLGEGHTSEK